ncbi:MAG TPA: acyl carrier protein phosphodiesterase [Salinimicrobium sp.]|nr:acyl carrier protein phosphodiesterase [Salinimicrobium sp.]
MNFLAHIYLSGNDEKLMIGNFIADSIKGRKYLNYPARIQKGILLHRTIDSYTDTHPIVRKSRKRLFETYGHYSGVIVDILYDHFLAVNWKNYSRVELAEFVNSFYKLLRNNFKILPKPVQGFLPYMIKDNWLVSYAEIEGIGKILYQMNERTQRKSNMHLAVNELKEHYPDFEAEFSAFFVELELFTADKIKAL